MKTAIHWFRRDFRLTDNTALLAAVEAAESVVPVYILSSWKRHHHWTGPNRQEFLCACLRALAGDVKMAGGELIMREGTAEKALEQLVQDTGAEAIFFNRSPDPFGRAVEEKIVKLGEKLGIEVSAQDDAAVIEPGQLFTKAGKPFRVYSPYFRAWSASKKPTAGPRVGKLQTPAHLKSLPLPTLAHWGLKSEGTEIIEAGETAARERMDKFFSARGAAKDYAVGRTKLMGDTTSRFSQDLRWGLTSGREVVERATELAAKANAGVKKNVEKFLSEIAWRDFCFQILRHYPHVLDGDFDPATEGLPWHTAKDHPKDFARWCEGKTGFPIVDAGMRQLAATGFMHNRVRMITAMFLTKDLHIYWRDGEAFFLQKLVDGEIANNNTGWQWSAGTGADAAPYFRIQNPWTQSERFDPKGEYIRRWVAELCDVEPARFHEPPEPGKSLAKGYPPPMVDHARERDATLEMFRRHRQRREKVPAPKRK